MDLLGRKVVADQGGALRILGEEITEAVQRAAAAGVEPEWGVALDRAMGVVGEVTMNLAGLGV